MRFIHIVSCSTGKDSQDVLNLAIERCGKENVVGVLTDTGNEDPAVFEHVTYLERTLGIKMVILKADFSEQIANRRAFVAQDRRVRKKRFTTYNDDGTVKERRVEWVRYTNKAKRRILAVLHPSGNPFLDLCLWKGRFPSRRGQFCTEELKRNVIVEYQMGWIDRGYGVISWQGVRRDESANRKDAKLFERVGKRLWTFRPIILKTAQQVVDANVDRGQRINPLYYQGFDRVGCMPCINCGKDEIRNVAQRRPEAIDRLREWERLVSLASKRGASSFFPNPNRESHLNRRGIDNVVEWAKTGRGGKQYDMLYSNPEPPAACASSYGLCDNPK